MTNTKTAFAKKVKRMSRKAPVRIVALVLMVALVMNVSLVVTLLPVFAGNNTATTVQGDSPTASVTNDDLQISGSNSFGNLLATKVNDYQNSGNEDEYTEGYSVIGIEMNGKTATVEYNAVENCMLVVGLYTEDGVKMHGSGNATVSPDSQSTNVEIAISEMPQYYLVKAFLVNPSNYYPLCKVFTCELYTKSIQEVMESTVEDYPNREILNLDGDNATNFAVYGLGVNVIKQSEGKNTYLAGDSNPNSGKYVFANADSEFASLKVGDIFSHERGAEVIIAKVKSIEAIPNDDGTYTLTIIEDNNIAMEDVFDYVKIENNGKINSYTIDDSVADECVKIPSENEEPSSGSSTGNFTNTVNPKEYKSVENFVGYDSINIKREIYSKKQSTNSEDTLNLPNLPGEDVPVVANVEISLKLNLTVTTSLKAYLALSECYLEFKLGNNLSINGTISGDVTVNPVTICQVGISPVPGVYITFEPKPEFSANASLNLDFSYTHSAGIKCSTKSGLSKLDSTPVVHLKIGVKGKLFFGINFKPALSIISEHVAEASMTAKVGVEIVGTTVMVDLSTSISDSSKHDCECCVDGDCNFVVDLSATVKFLNKKDWTYSAKLIPTIKIKICDWYWSIDHDEFGIDTCPYISYKITVLVIGKEGDPLNDISIFNKTDMNQELARTDETGTAVFYLPNGTYTLVAAQEMLAEREITVKDKPVSVDMSLNVLIDENGNLIYFGKCGANAEWRLNRDTGVLIISGEGAMNDYETENVVPWRYFKSYITSVEFEGAITSIGDRCFLNCGNLTNVTLPDTVTTIGVNAFRKCQKIIDINIPDSVISIKDGAFYECKALKNVSFGSSLKSIGEWVFAYTSVSSILFPESIESVGGKCFFAGYLNKVIIPESLTNFGLCVFQYCGGLKTVGPIGSNSNIEYGWKNSIPKKVFFGSSIEEIMIKDTIEVIEEGAFQSCDYLTTIKLPNSLKSIHRSAFRGCHTLQTIDLPESVSFIDADVFDGCYKLEDIVLPNSITAINDQTFDYCYALKSIVIPKSVTYIGQQAFESCSNLKAIYYTGSEEDWKKVRKHKWAGISSPTVYNYVPSDNSSDNPSPSPNPDASGAQSSTFNNLIPNANYLFVVSKSSDLDNMLDASNLLFIDEKTAGDSGSLTFSYIPREDCEGAVVRIFGPVNPSVTLDTTSATLKKGDKLTITAMVDQGHSANDVVWSSSNQKIATVSKGQVTAIGFGDAEISAKLNDCVVKCVVSVVPDLDFTILGASIRLSEPYGIRFGIQLGKGGDYTKVKIVEYGTLMKPTQLLGDEELTLQTSKIQKIPSTVTYSETDAALIYTGVLINIPTTYFDTAVSGRGYFIYEDENGVNHTIYTDTVSMSFNDVVEAAYNKYSKLTNPTDAQKVVLQKLEKLRALSGNN